MTPTEDMFWSRALDSFDEQLLIMRAGALLVQ